MIEEPATLTIRKPSRRPTAAQIAAFQNVPTGFVVDAMLGKGAMASNICPIGDGRDYPCTAAGPALTVDNGPGDILALLASLNFIEAGDVVVSTVAGHQGNAAAGDRVCGMMKNNGAAGFVTDGPMRDYAGVVGIALPAWCTGLTPASPFSTGPGEIGRPITIAEQHVETGDMIIADRDGVVVVPFAQIDEVIEALVNVTELETDLDAQVADGLKIPDAIEQMLETDSVKIVSD